jgi:nucleoside-diphosphate-sugar epimerase
VRVLVTGAAGFLGRHLVPALAQAGHDVHALVRPGAKAPAGATRVEIDLSEPLPRDDLPAVDAVVHLAQANVPFPAGAAELYRVNAASTADLLTWAHGSGVARFVYASTGSVYGHGADAFPEDAPLAPPDFYALTKAHGEAVVAAFAGLVETAILRPFALFGPGQSGRLVPRLVERVTAGEPVHPGPVRLNPLYVDDATEAVTRLLDGAAPAVLNLAGDDRVSVRELAGAIGEAVGREPVFEDVSESGERVLVGDNSRLRALLGRAPTPLAEGLRRTVEAG